MKLITKLEKIGFSKKEAQIYIELIQIGSTSIGKLEKNLGEKRQTLIYSIKKLISKGFVNMIQTKNFPVYSAVGPKVLEYDFKEKEILLQSCVKELNALGNKELFNTNVKFYTADQIENLFVEFDKDLKGSDEYFSITNLDYTIKHRKEELIEYRNRRMHLKDIKTNIITYYTDEVGTFLKEYGIPIGDEYRFIEKGDYNFSLIIEILKNKILILSVNPEDKYGIIIESKGFHESYKALFNTLWTLGKR